MPVAKNEQRGSDDQRQLSMRRRALAKISHLPSTHPGLWLDKFLQLNGENNSETEEQRMSERAEGTAKRALIEAITNTRVPAGYTEALRLRRDGFEAQRDAAEALPEGSSATTVVIAEATAMGRVVIGLGAKGVLEAGLRLEHTWGVPYLPGSSLKGLAAAAAHKLLADDDWRKRAKTVDGQLTSFETLFGTTDASGLVMFHEAWWIPEGNVDENLPIHHDVMTVHHRDYYQGNEQELVAPSDMDSPVPVPFATVKGRFLVALEGPLDWCRAAFTLLELGLRELGIGAKTNAGYGRMSFESMLSPQQQIQIKELDKREAEALERAMELTREEERALEAEREKRRIIEEKLLRIGDRRDLPSQARDRLALLEIASSLNIAASSIKDAASQLHDADRKFWKAWPSRPKCTDNDRDLFNRYISNVEKPLNPQCPRPSHP